MHLTLENCDFIDGWYQVLLDGKDITELVVEADDEGQYIKRLKLNETGKPYMEENREWPTEIIYGNIEIIKRIYGEQCI